jgi:hypothetical protein
MTIYGHTNNTRSNNGRRARGLRSVAGLVPREANGRNGGAIRGQEKGVPTGGSNIVRLAGDGRGTGDDFTIKW